jgi:hypothetical protein
MNKAKGIFWLIVLGFFTLLIFQNQDFFLERQTLRLNPYIGGEYQTPDLPIVFFFVIFVLIGFFIAYFFGLYGKFKANQTIKGLNAKQGLHLESISNLNAEIESLKSALERKNREAATVAVEEQPDQVSPDEIQKSDDEA